MTAQYDLIIEQGESFSQTITWEEGSPLEPVNLTGMTAALQIRDSGSVLVVGLTQAAGLALGGSAGTIAITLTADQTEAFDFTIGRYDLFIYGPDGYAKKVFKGTVILNPSETQE